MTDINFQGIVPLPRNPAKSVNHVSKHLSGMSPVYTPSTPNEARLLKHDLAQGTRQVHDFGPGRIASEFVFVPAAGATAEDHGWLMGYVITPADGTSDLVILNAQDFTGAPQAVIHIPNRIPPGFHGNWVPAKQ